MSQTTSSRLPGVPQLQLHFSGPEYSRWRRTIKFALQAKGTWKYCNGNCPMPMPEAATSRPSSVTNPQPSLLDERRDWVKHDREVKLDIFLSLAEDVMQEVLEVGPPLPPSNLSAQEMLESLDARFAVFKFEAYHHAFCHFLNLHVEQFPSLEAFNQEFSTTLEDLVDHGHPLSNVQACSAYFSKLRCTQNPWVAKKLLEWDAQTKEIHYTDLLEQSPPWSIIRPLTTKPSQVFQVESIPEEQFEDSSESDSDAPTKSSNASSTSSVSLHSRRTSNTSLKITDLQGIKMQREEEITILASSNGIAKVNPEASRNELEKLNAPIVPERGSSKNQVPERLLSSDPSAPLPEWLASKKSVARPLPPTDRPLPALPTQPGQSKDNASRSARHSAKSSQASVASPSLFPSPPQLPTLKLETTHPTLRPTTPTEVHPALRSTTTAIPPTETHPALRSSPPQPTLNASPAPPTPSPQPTIHTRRRPSFSSPDLALALPWPSLDTPTLTPRPHSSSADLPATQSPNPLPSQTSTPDDAPSINFATHDDDEIQLPLQGTRDSAWAYLYEAKGGYLIQNSSTSTSSPFHSSSHHPTAPSPSSSISVFPHQSLLTQSLQRIPTYDDTFEASRQHKKASSLDFMTRLSGDGAREEREREKKAKKKSWMALEKVGKGMGMHVSMSRFSAGKGVREMI
ncbi:hypothetical protein CC86DRAFT_326949 [Ophiobolus disseminans]|uniref:Retrotransposon Copia-like N-terminal domain-containing protein n=1 Tax=Ophiobolus disseminans TaxID=1469910 RepID=A0A6A6ZU48_9PLEO|nr:hypothetical protein CC86DRAFT_326949 [Ophiobolus disseminans]